VQRVILLPPEAGNGDTLHYAPCADAVAGNGRTLSAGASGMLEALDVQTGESRWQYRSKYPMMASVLATGGGLVLTGDVEGNALAFAAANGELLRTFNTGSGNRGSPITYALGGKQYIAVPSGWGGGGRILPDLPRASGCAAGEYPLRLRPA
jgi:outer membrane protein assembly factor BamB